MLLTVAARLDVDDEAAGVLLRVIRVVIFCVWIMCAVVIVLMMLVKLLLRLGLRLRRRLLLLLLTMMNREVMRAGVVGQMGQVGACRGWRYTRAWDHGTPSGYYRVIPVRSAVFQRLLLIDDEHLLLAE